MPASNPSSLYGPPNFIVDATPGKGSHTTITAAMTAASSPANIYIRPGTYTENVTGKTGVNLIAYTGDSQNSTTATALVTINGTYSASFTGTASISGINFTTNSANSVSLTGTNVATITFQDCSFIASTSAAINHTATNTRLILRDCFSDFTNIGGATFLNLSGLSAEIYSHVGRNTIGSNIAGISISAGVLTVTNSIMNMRLATSGTTSIFNVKNSTFDTSATNSVAIQPSATTVISEISFSNIISGSSAAINLGTGSLLYMQKCVINSSAVNVITQSGAAGLGYDDITFTSGSNISVTTQARFNQSVQYLQGITFDTANILQNYATGTWTPVAAGVTTPGTGTYSLQSGRYTRIGNRVCVQCSISWTAHTGTGNLTITGLPVTSANVPSFTGYVAGYYYNSTTNIVANVFYQIQPNTTTLFVIVPGTGVTNLQIGTNQNHQFTLWYEV